MYYTSPVYNDSATSSGMSKQSVTEGIRLSKVVVCDLKDLVSSHQYSPAPLWKETIATSTTLERDYCNVYHIGKRLLQRLPYWKETIATSIYHRLERDYCTYILYAKTIDNPTV